jgi:hypothetical protein
MLESYEDLVAGLGTLSNHFKKYLRFVEKSSFFLRQRLDDCGMTGKVHLWRKAHNYRREMQFVASVAQNQKEIRVFLGTYFTLQVLQLHFLNIDWLRRETVPGPERSRLYHNILTRFRFQLRNLVSCYLSSLFEVFSGEFPSEGIAFCNVGMILDQDDLDVGIFIAENLDQKTWNRVTSQVSNEFLKYSTKMHFYLAEFVAPGSFLITLKDFKNYLDRGINNFVLVTELLVTEFLFGDSNLLRRLESEIIDKFYYEKGNRRLHEGYIRGMMGEIQELLRFDSSSTWISPKNQGLRLIHSLMNVMKTIHGFYEHGYREAIDNLQQKDIQNADRYRRLHRIFDDIEMFFYVYQLVVSVDDIFDCNDETTLANLDIVAKTMGISSFGIVRPGIRLMTTYYEHMEELCRIGREFQRQIDDHLKRITVFNSVLNDDLPTGYPVKWTDNKALNAIKLFRIYSGLVYWDDILGILGDEDGKALKILFDSMESLEKSKRNHTFNRLLKLLSFDMDSIVMVGVLLSRHIRTSRLESYSIQLRKWLNQQLEKNSRQLLRFINLTSTHPSILAEYLLTLSNPQLLTLIKLAKSLDQSEFIDTNYLDKFIVLCELIAFSSNNYLRMYSRVAKHRPEIVNHINDISILDGISIQLWSELSDVQTPDALKKRLAVYYEFSFCLCGLLAINHPGNIKLLYETYHSFFRRYFRWLYRACQWAVDQEGEFNYFYRERDEDDQPLALFCVGGYAREEAFENDIDLIVVSWDSDPEFIRYASRIINEINRELSKQGVIPHFRYADFFDSFIVPIDKLSKFFSKERETDFIEYSQLLGSRLLVGGHTLELEITRLLDKFLFTDPSRFIRNLLTELEERNAYQNASKSDRSRSISVKEDAGALRDIQIIVTACQAYVGIQEPVMWKVLQCLSAQLRELENEFNVLGRAYRFMRFFKDTYALSLAGVDDIMRDRLISTAHRMGLEEGDIEGEEGSAPRLLNSYRYHKSRSRQAIASISRFLLKEIS